MTRRSTKGIYGPPIGKKMVLFVDDLNMPRKEKYGAQPPVELLRQCIDNGGWFDHKEKHKPFKQIVEYMFIGGCQPPGQGRQEITPRMSGHLSMISFTSLDNEQMVRIFQSILNWFFHTRSFNDEIKKLTVKIVNGTLETYKSVINDFKPTPVKSHYTFNLRDFARVIHGVCLVEKEKVNSPESIIKLWVHEVWRVYNDRLNDEEDRRTLLVNIKKITQKCFGISFDNLLLHLDKDGDNKIETIVEMRGLIFSDIMYPGSEPKRYYEEITDYTKLQEAVEEQLEEYNIIEEKPMPIVLFNFAIEHLLIISRILKQPGGNG